MESKQEILLFFFLRKKQIAEEHDIYGMVSSALKKIETISGRLCKNLLEWLPLGEENCYLGFSVLCVA